jgi:transposase
VVADHDAGGAVIWADEGRSAATVASFFSELGADRAAELEAVSCDMSAGYLKAIGSHAPDARVAIDPLHVVKLANEAIDACRRRAWHREALGKLPVAG